MKSIDKFDPLFFGISPREAEAMDPQQRLMLEASWEAMEMAGYAQNSTNGSSTGVFVGLSSAEYARTQLRSNAQVTAAVGLGNSLSIVANRISYQFNLKGPSLVVDTACSSSSVESTEFWHPNRIFSLAKAGLCLPSDNVKPLMLVLMVMLGVKELV